MSSSTDTDTNDTERNRTENDLTSRRTLLKTTAVVGATVGLGGVALAQSGGDALQSTSIELGGEVAGWQGRSPSSIEGQTNPTLTLEAGTTYEVTWENLDGQPHNIRILDSDGNELHRTELVTSQGATQTTSFTASSEMAQYDCEVHPSTMVGDVSVQGQSGSGGNGTNQSDGNETNQSDDNGTNQSDGNETNQSVQPTEVGQGTNASTNESGGLDDWNVTANGSAEPEVVDSAAADPSNDTGPESEQTNATEQAGNETTQQAGGNETDQGGNGKAKTGNGKAKNGNGKRR